MQYIQKHLIHLIKARTSISAVFIVWSITCSSVHKKHFPCWGHEHSFTLLNQPILCCRTSFHLREYLLSSWREFVMQLQENVDFFFFKIWKQWLHVTGWHCRSVLIERHYTAGSLWRVSWKSFTGLLIFTHCYPAVCCPQLFVLLLEWAFKMAGILSEHAEGHWSLFSPESSVSKVSLGHRKKPQRDWNGEKGIWHLNSAVRDVPRMERLCADQCKWITGPSLSWSQYLTLLWNFREQCLGTSRCMWMQTRLLNLLQGSLMAGRFLVIFWSHIPCLGLSKLCGYF